MALFLVVDEEFSFFLNENSAVSIAFGNFRETLKMEVYVFKASGRIRRAICQTFRLYCFSLSKSIQAQPENIQKLINTESTYSPRITPSEHLLIKNSGPKCF